MIWCSWHYCVLYIVSKGLTSAVLNTSKLYEEIGDLYAKQVNVVMLLQFS